jgi:hypothetical protein
VKILVRPKGPVWLLVLLAPAIPELMTGSTSLNGLVLDPPQFAVQIVLLLGLYGAGCLLVREFSAIFHKGWASVLLLGAAYGILEEGIAVHTFFQSSGSPVDAFASYGRFAGVNWLWALGLTIFHATYSIALPILLVYLVYPTTRGVRWLDASALIGTFVIYVGVVAVLALTVPQGPSAPLLSFFLTLVGVLILLAWWVPPDALTLRRRLSRLSPRALVGAGMISFATWVITVFLAALPGVPAVGAAAFVIVGNAIAVVLVLFGVGWKRLEVSEVSFALGMLAILWGWDLLLLAMGYWAITVVIGGSAYLIWLLRRRVLSTSAAPTKVPTAEVAG